MSDTTSGDSAELEALFNSISVGAVSPPSAPPVVVMSAPLARQAPDLPHRPDPFADASKASGDENGPENVVFTQVGQMARQLHDTLVGLGYNKIVEKTVGAIPDARDRLAYIANITEQAACKVLNATDTANPLQDEIETETARLAAKWDTLYANRMDVEEFRTLAGETRAFLKDALPQKTAVTKTQLLEIMMAQDFQDLTGQVIKKVVELAQELETQLMSLLIDTIPVEKRTDSVNSLLNGPVINAEGRSDVVASQHQVDDLLESLGF
jgi:chemotaxis protein CheZ